MGLPDPRTRPADDEEAGAHVAGSLRVRAERRRERVDRPVDVRSECCAVTVSRMRAVPAGTVGGRMARTWTPRPRIRSAQRSARAGRARRTTGTMCPKPRSRGGSGAPGEPRRACEPSTAPAAHEAGAQPRGARAHALEERRAARSPAAASARRRPRTPARGPSRRRRSARGSRASRGGRLGPAANAPWLPKDFPSVPTSTSGTMPASAQRPRARGPQHAERMRLVDVEPRAAGVADARGARRGRGRRRPC